MLRHTLLRSRSLVACATRRAPLISGVGVAPAVCARHAARRLHAARPTADGALANDTPAAAVEHDAAGASATHAANSFDPAALTGLLLDLHSRGMLAALTNPREMIRHLSGDQPRVIYAGFDPTAESLHIGNLLVLMVLRRCQKWGHKPICLVRQTSTGTTCNKSRHQRGTHTYTFISPFPLLSGRWRDGYDWRSLGSIE